MYSTEERKRIMDEIIVFAEQNEHIIALIAVGSGSYGYIDELSDLDMVVAIDSDENTETVMEYISSQLKNRLSFIYFKQVLQSRLQVYMCDSFLEIDIGYGPYTWAAAFRKDWRVLFDKSGTVEEKMLESWKRHEESCNEEAYNKKAAECADVVWHHLMHAAVAIKRGQSWRADAELSIARNSYIELLGCRYSLETARGRDTDKLPENELEVLSKTLVTGFERKALWSALNALVDAVYSELERCGEQAHIPVSRARVNEYIDMCRKLEK